jgi:peptide/nickel transport system substrate-binding protein
MRKAFLLSALAILPSCSGETASDSPDAGGTVVIASGADPDILMPMLTTTSTGRMVSDQVFERLVELPPNGPSSGDEGYVPRLAKSWTWSGDSLSISFSIDPAARWHDGRPVRAQDVAFTYRLATDSTSGSTLVSSLDKIDSVTAPDSLTAVFWFSGRYPNQFFDATYQMFIVPEHLLKDVKPAELRASEFGRNPVGSGKFRFVSWEPRARLELIADTAHYRGRPPLDRVILSIAPDYTGGLAKLLSGEADFYELIRPDNMAEVQSKPNLQLVKYPSLQYGFMLFNQRTPKASAPHPVLGDAGVRRAISMALDRKAMVHNVLDTLGSVGIGPAPRAIATSDSTIRLPAFDLEAAKSLLDSLGWRAGSDGMRRRNGRPLEFTLMTPSSSQTRVKMAVLIQEQLRQAGIKVNVEQMDFGALQQRLRARDFDASMNVVATDPVPNAILQSWGTASITGGQNFGSYSNPRFEALVDSGSRAGNPAQARAYLKRAYQAIVDDAPAVWLYEPSLVAGKHKRIRTPNMRVDAWWSGLADWSIPEAERIERDRIGLRTAQ